MFDGCPLCGSMLVVPRDSAGVVILAVTGRTRSVRVVRVNGRAVHRCERATQAQFDAEPVPA
jgi:hypothetical protein